MAAMNGAAASNLEEWVGYDDEDDYGPLQPEGGALVPDRPDDMQKPESIKVDDGQGQDGLRPDGASFHTEGYDNDEEEALAAIVDHQLNLMRADRRRRSEAAGSGDEGGEESAVGLDDDVGRDLEDAVGGRRRRIRQAPRPLLPYVQRRLDVRIPGRAAGKVFRFNSSYDRSYFISRQSFT